MTAIRSTRSSAFTRRCSSSRWKWPREKEWSMKLAIHGYGKMGHTIENVAKSRGHEVVAVFDVDRESPMNGAEVLIDFSHASALEHALALACDNGCGLVIGTTGWNDRIDDVRKRIESAGIGAVYASNFSPGANVMFALARRAGEL